MVAHGLRRGLLSDAAPRLKRFGQSLLPLLFFAFSALSIRNFNAETCPVRTVALRTQRFAEAGTCPAARHVSRGRALPFGGISCYNHRLMDLKLKDKVVLVTGGSHGLGRAICLGLAAEGAKVGVNYHRNPEKAGAVVAEIRRAYGVEAAPACGDIANEADVLRMFDEIEQRFGPVDALVNNAAVCPVGPITEMTEADWNRTFQVNMTGTFLCSRELARRSLKANRPGRIVNIASQAAFRGSQSGKAPYDASKGAIVAFTVSLARELASKHIAVNAVAPGFMYTEMLAPFIDADREKFESRVPLHRIATLEEVTNVVVFLASDRASYMTGATVDVSGGLAMR
jgi:3-oxoacyl-[acyl-carrier protein] reductase